MTYHFPIIIDECEEGGYYGECPALPGCFVQGETLDEIYSELHAAIQGMIEVYKETGEPLPVGSPLISYMKVVA